MAAVGEAFTEAEESVRGALDELAKQQYEALEAVERHLAMKDEELQMLWWLTGQRSSALDCAFEHIPADAQPLILGSELAGQTEILPGPASVAGLLSRAGLKERRKISVVAAVNAVPKDWTAEIVGDAEFSPATTPIHFALQRRHENDGGEEWVANWASVTGIAAAHEVSCLGLGTLFYRERLLVTSA